MIKITYGELKRRMIEYNETDSNNIKVPLVGVIVFTEDSFTGEYDEEARSYLVSNNNKAFIPSNLGYSIFASSLDGEDVGVRLEAYMQEERGGKDGWKVDYCYMKED